MPKKNVNSKNTYQITVNKNDAIIILSENLETQLLYKEEALLDEENDDHIAIMTAIVTRMNYDPSFIDNTLDWLENFEEMFDDIPIPSNKWN